jgi:acyl-[acyl-carrier-protein]-phospholipid O-acyltransferase/long-chain-fatty-acid--[acyl-carrier-protein] ligase
MQNARFEAMDFRQNLWERLELAASWYGKNRPILEDASRAPLTYAEIISRARLLSLRLEDLTLRGERVGVLLPNRTLHALVLFALWSIGRVPVILNYTQGPALLNQALLAAGVKTIVSSRRFLEKAGLGEAASRLEAKTVFAEDFSFALSDRVAASLRTPAPEPPDCPAVVLFTAGSEGAPKGVAHSHQGLLANQLQAACHLECSEDDVFFNAVPMFHAAGLNMLLLAPLLQGMRSFLYPTPLHPHRIPRLIRELGVTVAAASASAAGAWARGARPRDFASVRVFVAGSERVSEETRGRFLKDFGVRVYEGYGVAEAGPALSASTPAHFKEGSCGRFLPGIERKLDPVEGLDKGGALSVKGPNVMMGYLLSDGTGELQPPPGGWHNTGDIVEEDQDGYVWIRGRQRRFAKVGGEMVSLAAVEDVLGRLWPGRPLAVMAADDPRRGERLVLATQERSVDVVGLRAAIRAAGLPEIAVPRQFVRLPTIPLTTAGAVDFAELRQQVAEALKAQAEGQGSAAEAEKAEKAEKAEAAEKVGNAEADE